MSEWRPISAESAKAMILGRNLKSCVHTVGDCILWSETGAANADPVLHQDLFDRDHWMVNRDA